MARVDLRGLIRKSLYTNSPVTVVEKSLVPAPMLSLRDIYKFLTLGPSPAAIRALT
jgi:hypothetical protein